MGHEHLVSVVFIENRFLASMVPVSRSFPNLHHNKSAKSGWFANLTRHNIFCDLDDSLIISQIIFLKNNVLMPPGQLNYICLVQLKF